MLTLIFALFGIIALLIVVALLIEYFPGRNRRDRGGSGAYWGLPEVYDHDGPDHHHNDNDNDNDGGWLDGGDFDAGD